MMPPKKGVGRPKKVQAAAPLVPDYNTLSASEVVDFRKKLLEIHAVSALPQKNQTALISSLVEKLPHYLAGKQLRAGGHQTLTQSGYVRHGPGRVPDLQIAQLLATCAKVWERATGVDAKLWETSERGTESVPVEIARVCMQIAEGMSSRLAGRLGRQIEQAKAILASPNSYFEF